MNSSSPTTLTPYNSKTVKDRENLLTYYWKLSLRGIKCKRPHQNRMKNKNFTSPAKSHFLNPLTPFLKKTVNFPKNAWSNFCCIFQQESFAKNPIKIGWEIKKFQKLGCGHFRTPYISITVRDRSWRLWPIMLTFSWGIQRKKPHQNWTRNRELLSK